MYGLRIPPDQEGRFAIVTNVGWDAMDASAQLTNAARACGKSVWSWSPDAGIKFAEDTRRATVANKPDTGESAL